MVLQTVQDTSLVAVKAGYSEMLCASTPVTPEYLDFIHTQRMLFLQYEML
jgi:hypothetical protein